MEEISMKEDELKATEEILCEICSLQPKKYKCPGCSMFTCSLECCKSHKQKTGCTGQRDRTKYVPIKEYKENSLRSDYHFLEDVLQTKDRAKRIYDKDCLGKKGTKKQAYSRNKKKPLDLEMFNTNTYQNLDNYPKGVKVLFNAAKERKTKIIFQPPGMSRRQENTTQYNPTTNIIAWKLTCIFVLPDAISMTELNSFDMNMIGKETITSLASTLIGHNLNNLDETCSMQEILDKAIETMPNGSSLKQIVKAWSQPLDTVHCLIKVIPSPANNPLFKEVLMTNTIKEMLSDHTVIEFPTIYFVHTPALMSFRMLIAGVNDPLLDVSTVTPSTVNPRNQQRNNKRTRKQQQQQQQQRQEEQQELEQEQEETKRRKLALAATIDAAVTIGSGNGIGNGIGEDGEEGEVVEMTKVESTEKEIEDGIIGEESSGEEGEGEEDGEEEEEEEEGECDDFMHQLMDLQDLDAEQLRRIIQAEEAKAAAVAAAVNTTANNTQ